MLLLLATSLEFYFQPCSLPSPLHLKSSSGPIFKNLPNCQTHNYVLLLHVNKLQVLCKVSHINLLSKSAFLIFKVTL